MNSTESAPPAKPRTPAVAPSRSESLLASPRFKLLVGSPASELERILSRGETPSTDALVGHEYRGFNHPPSFALIGIRKFIKAFFQSERGEPFGCNTPVMQNGIEGPWVRLPDEARPKRFGFYTARPVDPGSRDHLYPRALLLDYGRGKNPLLDVTRNIRDYIVRVDPGSDELLLGKAYIAIGPARVPTNFFFLERLRAVTIAPEHTRR